MGGTVWIHAVDAVPSLWTLSPKKLSCVLGSTQPPSPARRELYVPCCLQDTSCTKGGTGRWIVARVQMQLLRPLFRTLPVAFQLFSFTRTHHDTTVQQCRVFPVSWITFFVKTGSISAEVGWNGSTKSNALGEGKAESSSSSQAHTSGHHSYQPNEIKRYAGRRQQHCATSFNNKVQTSLLAHLNIFYGPKEGISAIAKFTGGTRGLPGMHHVSGPCRSAGFGPIPQARCLLVIPSQYLFWEGNGFITILLF